MWGELSTTTLWCDGLNVEDASSRSKMRRYESDFDDDMMSKFPRERKKEPDKGKTKSIGVTTSKAQLQLYYMHFSNLGRDDSRQCAYSLPNTSNTPKTQISGPPDITAETYGRLLGNGCIYCDWQM